MSAWIITWREPQTRRIESEVFDDAVSARKALSIFYTEYPQNTYILGELKETVEAADAMKPDRYSAAIEAGALTPPAPR